MNSSNIIRLGTAFAAALAIVSDACGQADVLPSIQLGNIAIELQARATGLAAPDYAISAPGDTNRMFILEQKGQVLVMQNGSLLATPALDLQSLVAPPMVLTNANDERGLLGIAFHPGFNNPSSAGFHTVYTYNSQLITTAPTYAAPNSATQGFKNVVNEFKMSLADPNVIDPATRREVISFGKNANNHNGGTILSDRTDTCISASATAEMRTTLARVTSSPAATGRTSAPHSARCCGSIP